MIFFWSVSDISLIGLSCAHFNKKMLCSGKLNMISNQCNVKKIGSAKIEKNFLPRSKFQICSLEIVFAFSRT